MEQLDKFAKISMIFVGLVVAFTALSLLKSIFTPLAFALVCGVVLSPLSDFWEDRGYTPVVGALIGLIVAISLIAGLVMIFQPVVSQLVDQAPKVWADMQETIRTFRGLLRGLSDMTEGVNEAISTEPVSGAAAAAPAAGDASVGIPTVTDAVLAAPAILSQVMIFIGALFFFLLTRTEIYDWIARSLSQQGQRAVLTLKLRRAEREVSRYFITITIINAGLGAAIAIILQVLGMPGAILWGVIAFVLNFVVYLGPALFVVTLLFAGVAVFDGGLALLPAASFLFLNTLEGQFVTPALVGRNMAINPLLVFLALIFGIWLWGPIGGIVAIPSILWVMVMNRDLAADQKKAVAAK